VRPDGSERVVHERARPEFDEAGRPARLVGTVQDITERKLLESQLRLAQKMEAVGRLAGGVAHDFNNILTVILGYTEVVLSSPELSPRLATQLKKIATAAERASSLTRQLIAFGRRQVMQPKALDLNQTISQTTQMLHRLLGEDVELRLKFAPDLPAVWGDLSMMEQVFVGLAVHARQAMPRGGKLSIETGQLEVTHAIGRPSPDARAGRFVSVAVADTGLPLDPDAVARIFEPYYSTKELGRGTGLGLASVYGIVKQHEGWIEVDSAPDRGTTFRVLLPVHEGTPEGATGGGTTAAVRGGQETILVVEDESALRALALAILQRHGYHVLEAGSGPEALDVWARHAANIDMLFTDIIMPGGMTGRDLALKLLEQKPSLRVLYTTGYSVDLVESDFSLKPGLDLIPKPYSSTALARAVRQSLDRKPSPVA
jgi:signal transduction histidine kinase/ActR/RegA family two-component response regulator